MRLYNKNLTSIEDLREEQARLRARSSHVMGSALKRGAKQDVATRDAAGTSNVNLLQTGLDFATSFGFWNKAFALALPALKLAGRKVQKSTLQVIAKDVLGAYLKWKLVMLGYRFAKNRFAKD